MELAQCQQLLNEFLGDRNHDSRYASFDYCYGYFQGFRHRNDYAAISEGDNLRRSCLELGFYLASWGMLRGSSDLLNKSVAFLRPMAKALATAPAEVWNLDVDSYNDKTWEILKKERNRLTKALGNLRNSDSDTLITKIMLGVYGNVPAFDQYFKVGLGVSLFGPGALELVQTFYSTHQNWIDSTKIPLLAFEGDESRHNYSKAKLVDMIFFMKGLNSSRVPAIQEPQIT